MSLVVLRSDCIGMMAKASQYASLAESAKIAGRSFSCFAEGEVDVPQYALRHACAVIFKSDIDTLVSLPIGHQGMSRGFLDKDLDVTSMNIDRVLE